MIEFSAGDHGYLVAHIDRTNQFVELYQQVSLSYEALKSAYEQQGKELKESKLATINYKHQAHYWEAQFKQIKSREEILQEELEELKAKLRKREQQLFGNRSEKKIRHSKKKRGQQPNNASPNRRDYSDLPEFEEVVELNDQENHCSCCQLPYQELAGTEDSEVLEIINVQAYRRVVRRKRYKRGAAAEIIRRHKL